MCKKHGSMFWKEPDQLEWGGEKMSKNVMLGP